MPGKVNLQVEAFPCRNPSHANREVPARTAPTFPTIPCQALGRAANRDPGRQRNPAGEHGRSARTKPGPRQGPHPLPSGIRPQSGCPRPRRPCRQTSSWRATCSPRSTGPGNPLIPGDPLPKSIPEVDHLHRIPGGCESGRTIGRSGDTYIATITTSPSVPHSMAVAATTGKSIRRSRSLKVTSQTPGSRRTRSAVKTVAMTGTRNASWMDTEALVITTVPRRKPQPTGEGPPRAPSGVRPRFPRQRTATCGGGGREVRPRMPAPS